MRHEAELCEVCQRRPAGLFMVVRQVQPGGHEVVAKAHACYGCFELMVAMDELEVRELSLQEWKEVQDKGWSRARR